VRTVEIGATRIDPAVSGTAGRWSVPSRSGPRACNGPRTGRRDRSPPPPRRYYRHPRLKCLSGSILELMEGRRPRRPRIFCGSGSEKRLARPLALQVHFASNGGTPASASVEFLLFRIEETAREAARPPGSFQHQVEGRRPRRPRIFYRSGSKKRLARPLALQVYFRINGGTPASASAYFLWFWIGETAREAARPPGPF